MKKIRQIIGISLFLVGGAVAAVSANNTKFALVYFTSGSQCLPAQATICDPGQSLCDNVLITPDDTSIPPFVGQIYQPQATSGPCVTPYTRN